MKKSHCIQLVLKITSLIKRVDMYLVVIINSERYHPLRRMPASLTLSCPHTEMKDHSEIQSLRIISKSILLPVVCYILVDQNFPKIIRYRPKIPPPPENEPAPHLVMSLKLWLGTIHLFSYHLYNTILSIVNSHLKLIPRIIVRTLIFTLEFYREHQSLRISTHCAERFC